MAREIDERVVEMRFDNKQFEQGTKESMSTLDKLKQSLNLEKAGKAFDLLSKRANNVKLDGISKSVAALEKRFSTMGIVGMQVISNITNSLQSKLTSAVGFVFDSIIQGGKRRAMNIENAHFQLQALLKDEKKVQAIMDDAMQSVDGTAYAYDEAAKAASQFAATGLQAGKDMQAALSGITGVAAMTNSSYESISMIFTTVAGNGRLMGDQLLQLSSRGLNAASTIKDYFNGVLDGSKKANDELTAAIKNVSNGTKVTEGDIRDLVSKGEISFKMFSAAMTDAFGDSAKRANETFTGAFSNMKAALARIGAEFVSPLVAQNSEVVKLFNVLKDKINDFKTGITFSDEEKGLRSFSKRFTDMVLALSKSTANFVKNTDLTEFFEGLYDSADGVVNIIKTFGVILKPVGKAFNSAFGMMLKARTWKDFSKNFKEATDAIYKGVSKSSKELNDLEKIFNGIFEIAKTVVWIFGEVTKVFIPSTRSLKTFNGGLLSFTGNMGEALTSFSKWLRTSNKVKKVFNFLSKGVDKVYKGFGHLGKTINNVINYFGGFEAIGKRIYATFELLFGFLAGGVIQITDTISDRFDKLKKELSKIFKSMASGRADAKSLGKVSDAIIAALKIGDIDKAFEQFKATIEKIKNWFGTYISPFFKDMTFGSLASVGVGSGLIAAILKISKVIETVAKNVGKVNPLKAVNTVLGELGNTLKVYQKTLKSEQLKNIAIAIGILTASIWVLSQIDTAKLLTVMGSLTLVVVAIGEMFIKIQEATKKGETAKDALNKFQESIGNTIMNLGKAAKRWATGKMIESFAKSVALVAGAIIGLGLMYQENPQAIKDGGTLVGIIGGTLLGISTVMSVVAIPLGTGMTVFYQVAKGLVSLAAALYIIIAAMDKLFKMELPSVGEIFVKIGLLVGLFTALSALEIITAIASRISGGERFKAGSIIEIAGALYIAVLAVEKLFEMEIPKDFGVRFLLLGGIFAGMITLIKTVSKCAAMAGGSLKAGGMIVAMSIFLITAVGAIGILGKMKFGTILKGTIALGGVLLALGEAIKIASKNTIDDKGYKSILAMAVAAVSIAISLGILSAVPMDKLLVSAVALGGVLLALGAAMYGASKMDDGTWKSIIPMIVSVVAVSVSLGVLAQQPWESLLAAGGSLSAVLLSLSGAMFIMSKTKINMGSIGAFIGAIVMLGTATAALYILAQCDYKSVQAAGDALTQVMLAMSLAMVATIAAGALAPAAITGIGIMVAMVAVYTGLVAALGAIFKSDDAKQLINGGIDILNKIALGIGEFAGNIVSGFLNTVADNLPNIAIKLSAFAMGLQPFLAVMGKVDPSIAEGVSNICKALLIVTATELLDGIMRFFGGGIAWDSFQDQMTSFGKAIKAFSEEVKGVKEEDIKGAESAAKVMLALQQNLPREGGWVQNIFGEQTDLETFGDQLESFGKSIKKFSNKVKELDPNCANAAKTAGMAMSNLANSLPEEESWKSTILGGNSIDLDEFGTQLEDFGDSITSFADTVKDLDTDSIEKAKAAGEIMSKLASSLGDKDGLWQGIAGGGKQTLADFGDDLVIFGEDIAYFCEDVKNINTTKIDSFSKSMKSLVDMNTTMGTASTNMTKFSKSVKSMSKALDGLPGSITKGKTQIGIAIQAVFGGAVKQIEKYKSKFQNAAKSVADNFGTKMQLSIMRQSKGLNSAMQALGTQVGNGLAKGITDSTAKVREAAKSLAGQVDKQVRITLDIHSPSRVMRERGYQAGQGFSIGLDNSSSKVRKSADSIAKDMLEALSLINLSKNHKKLIKGVTGLVDEMLNGAKKKIRKSQKDFDIVKKVNETYAKVLKAAKKFYDDQADMKRKYEKDKEKYEKQLEKKKEAEQKLKEAKEKVKQAKEARDEAYGKKKKEMTAAQKKAQADKDLAKAQKELAEAEREAAKYGASTADQKAKNAEKNKKTAEKNKKTTQQEKKNAQQQKKNADDKKKASDKDKKSSDDKNKNANKDSKSADKNSKTSKTEKNNTKSDTKTSKDKEKNANRDAKTADKNAKTADKNAKTADKNAKTKLKNDKTAGKNKDKKTIEVQREVITEEDRWWMELLDTKRRGADAAEYLDMTYKEFQIKMLQDVAEIMKNYTDQLEQEKDNIMSSLDIFSDIEEEDPVSMDQLQSYLEKKAAKLKEFYAAYAKLMTRVKGTALEDLVSQMDFSNYAEVMALANATDEELKNYTQTYADTVTNAADLAKLKIEDVRKMTEEQLKELFNTDKDIDLFDFAKTWDGTVEGLQKFLDNLENSDKPKKIKKKVFDMTDGAVAEQLKELKINAAEEAKKTGEAVGNAVKDGITDSMSENPDVMKDQVDTYIDGAKDEKGQAQRAGSTIANAAINGIESRESSFYTAGVNAGSGFVAGLQSQLAEARRIAAELASVAAGSVNSELDIHSPSRVLMWSGNQAGLGFVLGLEQYIALAGKIAERMGNQTANSVNDGFSHLSKIMDGSDINVDPTITPQVDLTNVRSAADTMADLFNQAISAKQIAIKGLDVSIKSQKAALSGDSKTVAPVEQNNYYNLEQNNYSPKALSEIEIYRNTNNQFSQLKGVLNNGIRGNSH